MRRKLNTLICKIEFDGKLIKQTVSFKYLGRDIISYGDIEEQERQEVSRANNTAWFLNNQKKTEEVSENQAKDGAIH